MWPQHVELKFWCGLKLSVGFRELLWPTPMWLVGVAITLQSAHIIPKCTSQDLLQEYQLRGDSSPPKWHALPEVLMRHFPLCINFCVIALWIIWRDYIDPCGAKFVGMHFMFDNPPRVKAYHEYRLCPRSHAPWLEGVIYHQSVPIAICLALFRAHMKILFIIKARVLPLIKWSYMAPKSCWPLNLHLLACSSIFLYVCLFALCCYFHI